MPEERVGGGKPLPRRHKNKCGKKGGDSAGELVMKGDLANRYLSVSQGDLFLKHESLSPTGALIGAPSASRLARVAAAGAQSHNFFRVVP